MVIQKLTLLISILFLINSCSTTKKTTLLGTAIGSVIGATLGSASSNSKDNKRKRSLNGAAIGASLGGLLGYFKHQDGIKRENLEKDMKLFSGHKGTPDLSSPEIEKIWIPEKIDGEQYIEGHFIYVIRRNSLWQKK